MIGAQRVKHSAAVGDWFNGFTTALKAARVKNLCVYYEESSPWPSGPILIASRKVGSQILVGYINLPLLRYFSRFFSLFVTINKIRKKFGVSDTVVFLCQKYRLSLSVTTIVAITFKQLFGIRCGAIIGDGLPPFYKFDYALAHPFSVARRFGIRHWEGGVYENTRLSDGSDVSKQASELLKKFQNEPRKIWFLTGGGPHTGIGLLPEILSNSFTRDAVLVVSGDVDYAVKKLEKEYADNVVFTGFLSSVELNLICALAHGFINPRLVNNCPENQYNFPSKLLLFLRYEKPIICSVTAGISPEYEKFLTPIYDDDIDQYCSQITSITHASEDEYAHLCAKVSKLARDKTWARSIQRFKEVAQLN